MKLINRNNTKESVSRAELYESFADNATEGFLVFDSKLFLIGMNEIAIEILGTEHTAKIGSDIKDLLPNMYRSNRFELLHDVIRTNQPVRWRDHATRGDNIVAFEVAAFKLNSGLGMVVFDIDKRFDKITTLNSSDESSTAIQAVIHEPFLILDMRNRVLSANNAFYGHFYLKAQDVIEESIYDLNKTQWNIPALHELLEYKISSTGSAKNYEIKAYFTGLGERTLKLNAKQFLLQAENIVVTFLAVKDVTEVAKQRASLKKQIELFSKVPDAVIITDTRGTIIEMNNHAIELYGWSLEELIDKPIKSILPLEARRDHDAIIGNVLAGEELVGYEMIHWSKTGDQIPVVMHSAPLRDQNDLIYGTVSFMQLLPSITLAEKALKRSQEVLLRSNDPVIIVDLTGTVTMINAKAEQAYGWSNEKITGKPGSTFIVKDDQTAYEAALTDCLGDGLAQSLSIRSTTRQSIIREVELSFHLLTNVREEPAGVAIMEHEKSRNEQSSRVYSHLLNSYLKLPDAVILENMSGEIVDFNTAAATLYGWEKSALIGKLALSLVPEDQQAQANELLEKCKAGEVVQNVESRRWSKSGKHFRTQITMFQIMDSEEIPSRVVTISRQIASSHEGTGTNKLFETEMLFQESIDPIIIEDLTGKVIQINQAAEALFGWERADLQGKPIKVVIPAGNHKQHDKIILLCHNKILIQKVESECWSKEGKVFPVLVSLILLRDADGEPIAIANTFQDNTAFKKLQHLKQKLEAQQG
ncbi:MAG: PAS domain S-box protein [Candidatus Marinimicrobia bacterium]|nr:PAS domain S-box protein [Candidatus Neomarinimicrobiota bacterium]